MTNDERRELIAQKDAEKAYERAVQERTKN